MAKKPARKTAKKIVYEGKKIEEPSEDSLLGELEDDVVDTGDPNDTSLQESEESKVEEAPDEEETKGSQEPEPPETDPLKEEDARAPAHPDEEETEKKSPVPNWSVVSMDRPATHPQLIAFKFSNHLKVVVTEEALLNFLLRESAKK